MDDNERGALEFLQPKVEDGEIDPKIYLAVTRLTARGLKNLSAVARSSYFHLGLIGEIGEVCELFKRQIRDGATIDGDELCKELGDVLWYATRIDDEIHGRFAGYFTEVDWSQSPTGQETVLQCARRLTNLELRFAIILIRVCGYSVEEVALTNARKVLDRLDRGVIQGKGGDR